MKKYILLYILLVFCLISFGQKRTIITGYIPDLLNSSAEMELFVYYPKEIGNEHRISYKTKTNLGKFEYVIDLSETVEISLTANNKLLFFPGSTGVIINPGDSINLILPEFQKKGFLNIIFSGIGSEKNEFEQKIATKVLNLFNKDPDYGSQSINYKYQAADLKLNAIDSVCNSFNNKIAKKDIELIKSLWYSKILDMLFISSITSNDEQLNNLFKKFIVDKNRMAPVLKDEHIYFGSNWIVARDFILLSEFDNPIVNGGSLYRVQHPVENCNLILKYFNRKPLIKECLLSYAALDVFTREQDSENSNLIFKLYSDNVSHDSQLYRQVMDSFQIIKSRLKKGMAFYNFSLPDTLGNKHQLLDFKGKLLLLDFWFNGCGGCRQMAPILENIEKEYEGKDIQFISVSIDEKSYLWKKGIGKYCSKTALQLYTEGMELDHPLVKFLNPSGYPFLIVVDKNGNLIGPPPDPRVDSAAFKRFINQYL